MRAYQAHPKITRDFMLAEIEAHQEADRYVTGRYFQGGRGCDIGCALHSVGVKLGKRINTGNHQSFETYLGIPASIARLKDWFFENITPDKRATWPFDSAAAIKDGADLTDVTRRFLIRLLREVVLPVSGTAENVVTRVIAGFETRWKNDNFREARAAADAAAAAAADAAAYAYAAAYAADAAAYAAVGGGGGGSRGIIRNCIADILLAELAAAN